MSSVNIILTAIFASIIGGTCSFVFWERSTRHTDDERRYAPIVYPLYLAVVIVTMAVVSVLFDRNTNLIREGLLPFCVTVMLHTSLYFALLLFLLPLLRRRWSARACAMLWLLPNLLYCMLSYGGSIAWEAPLLVLPLSIDLSWLGWVWLGGSVLVLAYQVAQHFYFRRTLLASAREADADTTGLWRLEQREAGISQENLRLLVALRAKTPVSVGLWRWSMRVVLPERDYTSDELRLIFRHELIHICRQDAKAKLFMALCTAAMWWNPLMWRAMRRCADDLELGCDEFVLLDKAEDARRQYAALLLQTAGDERGFTTCLSATAQALKYRLENVLRPRKKRLGAVMLGAVAALLFLSYGAVTVAYAPQRLDEAVGEAWSTQAYSLSRYEPESGKYRQCEGTAALWDYLGAREVYALASRYDLPKTERTLTFSFLSGHVYVELSGRYVEIQTYGTGRSQNRCYMFTEEPDWNRLRSLLG